MAWCLANYPPGANLGIYNPRNVRGGGALSVHAEGRAIDVGYPGALVTRRFLDTVLGQLTAEQRAAVAAVVPEGELEFLPVEEAR